MVLDWIELHGSPVDAVIVLMGFAVVWLIGYTVRSQKAQNVRLWARLEKLNERYHRLDALQFGTAKAIQAAKGNLTLINESADGDGNHSLDRS
jgi:hypothetical protein